MIPFTNKSFTYIERYTYSRKPKRLVAEKLENKYTITKILDTLRKLEIGDTQYNGYIPVYKRTQLTDDLHKIFGFRTDYEIISKKKMRNIIKKLNNLRIFATKHKSAKHYTHHNV